MQFAISGNENLSTESAQDFFDPEAIGQRQDAGLIDDPKTGGDTASVGKGDHVREGDTYFGPRDFSLKFVNKENDDDDKEKDEDKEDKDEDKTKDDDLDGDDNASEEELRAALHTVYNIQAAINEHGVDEAVESLINRTGVLDLSSVVGEDQLGLEDYGLPASLTVEDYKAAAAHTVASLQAAIRDRMAGI